MKITDALSRLVAVLVETLGIAPDAVKLVSGEVYLAGEDFCYGTVRIKDYDLFEQVKSDLISHNLKIENALKDDDGRWLIEIMTGIDPGFVCVDWRYYFV